MFQFNYYRGETVKDICTQLDIHKDKARVIAGGTDLMVQIREKDEKWADLDLVIDISNLANEMKYIIEEDEVIRIGSRSTHTEIENSEIVKKY